MDLAVLAKDRIDENTRNDFTFNADDACMVDIFTAAEERIVEMTEFHIERKRQEDEESDG